MAVYMITFETQRTFYEYPTLFQTIETISEAFCNPLGSTWIIKSKLSSYEISDKLIKELDILTDYFLVVEITENKQGWLEKEMWNYIDESIMEGQ